MKVCLKNCERLAADLEDQLEGVALVTQESTKSTDQAMNVTVLYVGSSLLAPLKNAEREINRVHKLDLRVAAYNFGSPLSDREWSEVERDLKEANVVFVIHVMDGENASRLLTALEDKYRHDAVIVMNCMPDLMRRTRMGKLDVGSFAGWMARYAKRDKVKREQERDTVSI